MATRPEQPNKPDGERDGEDVRPVEDRAAVENQGEATPEDYPNDAGGKPDYGAPD